MSEKIDKSLALVAKKLSVKNIFFGDYNEKILTVSHKLALILTVNRKNHHPITTLFDSKLISPYNINQLSNSKVMRIVRNIN